MNRMGFTGLVLAAAALVAGSVAAAPDKTYSGEIMDGQCAKAGSHSMMMGKAGLKSAKDCTLACVKAGGHFVLYDANKKATYQLDDQTKPQAFAGEKVQITGALDKATNTIHVTDIKAGS